jgi:hypothetical protein
MTDQSATSGRFAKCSLTPIATGQAILASDGTWLADQERETQGGAVSRDSRDCPGIVLLPIEKWLRGPATNDTCNCREERRDFEPSPFLSTR